MNITLDNFRTQIGNQNYGEVIADRNTGALKTVNNGWFARHVSCVFGTKTTTAQHQDAAMKLYRAVRSSVGGANARSATEFLNRIAEQLGIQVEGENARATFTTPLSRRTIKSVVMETDKFKRQFFQNLRREADELAMEMASGLVEKLNDEGKVKLVGREAVRVGYKTYIRPVYGPNENFVPYAPILNLGHGLQFLHNCLEQNLIRDGQMRSEVNVLLLDRERLARFQTKDFATTEEMAAELASRLGSHALYARCERTATGVDYLKTTIWNDSVLLKYFREEIGRKVSARAHQLKVELAAFPDDISTENLRRLVSRQYEQVIAQVADEPVFTRHSMADKTKDLATLCIESMTDKEFKLTFAA